MRHYACKQYDYMACGQNINIKNIEQEYYFSVILIKSSQLKNNSKLKCPTKCGKCKKFFEQGDCIKKLLNIFEIALNAAKRPKVECFFVNI